MKTGYLRKILAFLLIGLNFLIQSCTIYEPQMISIPLMSEKNEVQLSGGLSALGGVYGSVAFAPAQHVALQVYGSAYLENSNFQGSVGYYTKNKSNVNFEVYAGFGFGKGTEYTDVNYTYSNADYLLYFLQGNVGQTNLGSAHIDYGFRLKTGIFDATVKDDILTNVTPYSTSALLIEPQAFIRMGGEKLKVGFQMNGTKIFINSAYVRFYEFYVHFNFGLSINYRFTPSLNKKKLSA